MGSWDAVVVGAGPNGLAAAITLAREGLGVLVLEANADAGGGARSAELTLPGFVHDVCSAVHPLATASPFMRTIPWAEHGVTFVHPASPLAHPFDDGTAAVLERDLDATGATLGRDARAWRRLFEPFVRRADDLTDDVLAPLRFPRSPLLLARFGLRGLRSAAGLARGVFAEDRARALFAGIAAHSMLPLDAAASASFGLVLGIAGHAVGWPLARGGTQRMTDALVLCLEALGGRIEVGRRVASFADLPPARAHLLDVTPRQLLAIAGDRLSPAYARGLARYRYGPGAFKIDWALREPIPWRAAAVAGAATVHLGGTFAELAASEEAVARGAPPERPYVILVQPTRFDPTRAPDGKHTAWAYCHVPNGCALDVAARIEAQVERFAPGFRDVVLARSVLGPAALEAKDANYVGGDVNGGSPELSQLFARPMARLDPYATSARDLYLCSSSTPPGGGVHGMCGVWAARSALRRTFGRRARPLELAR